MSANKQQKPTLNNNEIQDIFQGMTTSNPFNIELTYAEELSVVIPVRISDNAFDDLSTKEYMDLQPFKLPAVNGCEINQIVKHGESLSIRQKKLFSVINI